MDIAKCSDSKCPSKQMCLRFTVESNKHIQAYSDFHREEDAYNCNFFWNNENK